MPEFHIPSFQFRRMENACCQVGKNERGGVEGYLWKPGKNGEAEWNRCPGHVKNLQPFNVTMDEIKNERQPDGRTNDVLVAFMSAHESGQHESQSAYERGIGRQAKRMQIKVRKQAGQSIVDKQIEIESKCIRKQRKNDQVRGIKRLVE